MYLQPPSSPLPEPFASVRRRRPDADIVLLSQAPGPAAQPAGRPEDSDAAVEDARERVGAALTSLWHALGSTRPTPPVWTRFGRSPSEVVARAGGNLLLPGASDAVDLLEHVLGERGWDAAHPSGSADRLTARTDGLSLRVTRVAASTLVLELASDPLTVGVARARDLVRR